MEQTRKRMKFEILIERYFSNFHRILFANILFFVPLLVSFGIYYLADSFISNSVFIIIISILLAVVTFGFYSGIVLVCRNLARGDEEINVFSVFKKGVKDNYSKFMIYGLFVSLVSVLSYFSISVYSKLLSASWMFYVFLFVCIIIAIALLFIFFSAPIMTVTFDLSVRHILKNSFLMTFGEIKNNFFALISLIVVFAISFTILAFCTNAYLLIVMTLLLLALIVPASCQFVVSFFIYDDMYATISQRDAKTEKIEQAIVDARNKAKKPQAETVDYSDVDLSTLKNNDDYIFYNGKMIKQSTLYKLVLEQRKESSNFDKEV